MLEPREWKSGETSVAMRVVSYACSVANDEASSCRNAWPEFEILSSIYAESEWVIPDQEIIRLLVESFRQVPEVASIFAQFSADGIAIWTLLKEYDRDARQAVYHKELGICQSLGGCDFDFRVSSVDLVTPQELVLAGSREIFKRS